LHIIGSTSALDIPRLVVVSCSDGQGLLMEVPDLSPSSIWSLDSEVSIIWNVKVSVGWELRYYVEVSLNIKSESLVELSFCWFSLPFISIDDIPLLMDFVLQSVNTNVSVLGINTSLDFQNLSFLVCDVSSLQSEHLPPS